MAEQQKPPVINPPSSTPEQESTGLFGLLGAGIGKALQNLDCCLPAKVISFERTPPKRVTVQPMYKITSTGGETTQLAQIDSIPVLSYGGAGVLIDFDLKEGDLGWIIANDQDISLFLQSYEEAAGNTKRNHSFSDAFFIPDIMHDYFLAGKDGQAAIQTQPGTTYITIAEGEINIAVDGVFTYVNDVDLKGEKEITIPKDSLASSGGNVFRLLEDVTLNDKGEGKGSFKSVVIGDIPCPEKTLTEIVTKVAGWNEVKNEKAGQSQGGDKGISLKGDEVIINMPTVTVNSSNVTLNSSATSIVSPINIAGDVLVKGNVFASGEIKGNQPL